MFGSRKSSGRKRSASVSSKNSDDKNELQIRQRSILKKSQPEVVGNINAINDDEEGDKHNKINIIRDIIHQHRQSSVRHEKEPRVIKKIEIPVTGSTEELIKVTEGVISIGSTVNLPSPSLASHSSKDSRTLSVKWEESSKDNEEETHSEEEIVTSSIARYQNKAQSLVNRPILRHDSTTSADKIRKKTSFSVPEDDERFRRRRATLGYVHGLSEIQSKEDIINIYAPKKKPSIFKKSSRDLFDVESIDSQSTDRLNTSSFSNRFASFFGIRNSESTHSHEFYKQRSDQNKLDRQKMLFEALERSQNLNADANEDDDEQVQNNIDQKDLEEFELYLTNSEIALVRIHTGYNLEQIRKAKKPKYTFKQKIVVCIIDGFCCGCRCMNITS